MHHEETREPGIYPRWDGVLEPDGTVNAVLIIERVSTPPATEIIELSKDEAFLLGIFLSLTISKNDNNFGSVRDAINARRT